MNHNVRVGKGILRQNDPSVAILIASRRRERVADVAVPEDERSRSEIDDGAPKRETCRAGGNRQFSKGALCCCEKKSVVGGF